MPERQPTRRDMLTGRAVVEALENWADRLGGDASVPEWAWETAVASYLLRFERSAMACRFALFLNAGQHPQATAIALEAFDLLEALEEQLSVYRETSEVQAINRAAAEGPVVVEPRLFGLLELGLSLFESTEGAFDLTSGPLTRAWGFARRQGAIPTPEALDEARSLVGSEHLELDREARTICFRRPGVELNLGSIGKGYALDRCAEQLEAAEIRNFLWHGGQSSVLARGSSGERVAAAGGWSIGVRHPLQPQLRLAELILHDRALGTSGAGVQFFRHGGKRYGHILDPRTGWPAEGMFSSTIVAPTAALADALATACYVLGVERSLEWLRERPDLGGIFVFPSRDGCRVEIAWANLDDRCLRLLTCEA